MSEKRYKVPDGMLEAAVAVARADVGYPLPGSEHNARVRDISRRMLEAALGWLAENPVVPTDEQFSFVSDLSPNVKLRLVEWQRIMFRVPEQEVPEAVKDLIPIKVYSERPKETIYAICEAYRRGRESVGNETASSLRFR